MSQPIECLDGRLHAGKGKGRLTPEKLGDAVDCRDGRSTSHACTSRGSLATRWRLFCQAVFMSLSLGSLGCSTPGFLVVLNSRPDSLADARVFDELGDLAAKQGFRPRVGWEKERDPLTGEPMRSYSKRLSLKPQDVIDIEMFVRRSAPLPSIEVIIENRLRGMESPVKEEIEGLAKGFEGILAHRYGVGAVRIEHYSVSVPLFY